MYLSPDDFYDKYRRDGFPYFQVLKGNSTSEKNVMCRMLEKEENETLEEHLARGEEKLRQFFDLYPDGGFVTVICKTAPKNKTESNIITPVKWGTNQSAMTKTDTVGNVGGFGQMKQMMELMVLMQGLTKQPDTTAIQIKMLEEKHQMQLDQIRKENAWRRKREDLEALALGDPPSMGETVGKELIGLIKPLVGGLLMKQGMGAPAQQLPVVNGMERTVEEKPVAANPKSATRNPQPAAQHPMYNASFDLILKCVSQIAQEVFPDYSVNEVMPALVQVSTVGKDAIRANVIPMILYNRQQAETAKMKQAATTAKPWPNDEEE